MPPSMPPEITDAIISGVALDDYWNSPRPSRSHTLAMCALVCRSWLPRSRAELFGVFYIEHERTYDLLVERVVRSQETMLSPYLASVNSLDLSGSGSDQLSQAARLFFVEFAGKLPGLRTLDVYRIDFSHQRPSVKWPLLLSQFRTITSLSLWHCEFSSFNDVRRLLTALPLLSTLLISWLTWPTVPHEMHLQTTPRPRTYWPELHELRIWNLPPQCAAVFLRWITAALEGSPVKVLVCDLSGLPSTGSSREAVDAFVGRVWPSVTDLDIHIIDGRPLLGFTALKHLILRECHDYRGNWEDVASVLQGISSNMIEYIGIYDISTLKRRSGPESDNDATLHFEHDTLEEIDRVLPR
ncbi:hypothetical protein L227DRAFT_299761 [Lentinus tigrinus ALCF2SS1-6]|uniref:F-box domain-containing protein n=1 Tax=Lentinus tigrinus ALCF2SS1-6 TaxID=1328759 RepID=A0A5C2RXE6_9APHY|nr:hypothetical protein L227DRAFT_299761 [Lentinus tigrinus ALCF2SS1-6]